MSDDGLVSRAANDPLLQEVVELGKQLHDVWCILILIVNPEASSLDESQLAQFNDWKKTRIPLALAGIQELQKRVSPEADGLSKYPHDFPPLLYWLLGEAKKLLEQEAETTGEELVELAEYFGLVERQIMLAGANPPAVCKAPKLSGYAQYKQEQQMAMLDEWAAERSEWPERQVRPYQPVLQSPATHGDLVALREELVDKNSGENHEADDAGTRKRGVDSLKDIPERVRSSPHTPEYIVETVYGLKKGNPAEFLREEIAAGRLTAFWPKHAKKLVVDITCFPADKHMILLAAPPGDQTSNDG